MMFGCFVFLGCFFVGEELGKEKSLVVIFGGC